MAGLDGLCARESWLRKLRRSRVIGEIGIIEGSGARASSARFLVASERQRSRFADIRENVSGKSSTWAGAGNQGGQVQFIWRHTVVQKQHLKIVGAFFCLAAIFAMSARLAANQQQRVDIP